MSRELTAHRLSREIKELQQLLLNHQDKCNHKNASYKHGGNTGNLCEEDNTYWTTYKCPTCLKVWSVYV